LIIRPTVRTVCTLLCEDVCRSFNSDR